MKRFPWRYFKVGVLFLLLGVELVAGNWTAIRDEFEIEKSRDLGKARDLLIEIGATGDSAAKPFLIDVYENGASAGRLVGQNGGYPKWLYTYQGTAQVALANIGYDKAWYEIADQCLDPIGGVRRDGLDKLVLVENRSVVEELSLFLGDDYSESGSGLPLEWKAVIALTDLLQDPPFVVTSVHDIYNGYFSRGGREKWLLWRLSSFGPIAGREEIFDNLLIEEQKPAIGGANDGSSGSEPTGGARVHKSIDDSASAEFDSKLGWFWISLIASVATTGVGLVFLFLRKR